MIVYPPASTGGSGPSGPSGVDSEVTSWAELAAIATAALTKPVVVVWVAAIDNSNHITQLRAGTDATDTAAGIQRPDDYNAVTNAYVWYDT